MAQLVAHLHGMQGVRGSNPLSSTHVMSQDIGKTPNPQGSGFCCLGVHGEDVEVAMSMIPGFGGGFARC